MKKVILFVLSTIFVFGMSDSKLTGGVEPSKDIVLDNDYSKSAQIFKESCSKGHMYNCYNLANFYKDGRGVIKSMDNALKYYNIACDGGLPYACYEVGADYMSKKDFNNSNLYYKKACELGDDNGCLRIAEAYYVGEGVKKDLAMAKEFSKKACDLGNEKGCKAFENLK